MIVHHSSDIMVNPLFCWKLLRAATPKQRDEICLHGMVKKLQIGQSAGKLRTGEPSSTIYVGASASKWAVSQ